MRHGLVAFAAAILLGASTATAGGFNLAWDACYLEGGTVNKSFACDSNVGTNSLYVSVVVDVYSLYDCVGSRATIDLQSASSQLPAWWQFKNAGSCRMTSLVVAGAFPAIYCLDIWAGLSTGGIIGYSVAPLVPTMAPNRARLITSNSVPTPYAMVIEPGTEYVATLVRINNAKTVGLGNCAGCTDPVCLVLNEVLLYGERSGDLFITNPLASNYATWQGGAVGGPGCPGATPTLSRTWGQLKSIYR